MSAADVYSALVAVAATVDHVKTAALDYPDAKGVLELLPLATVAPGEASFGALDSETNDEESTWELWFFLSPLSKEADQPGLNAVSILAVEMMASARQKIIAGLNLDTAGAGVFRRIQVANRAVRRTALLDDLKLGGLPFWGFKVFLSVVEQEPV